MEEKRIAVLQSWFFFFWFLLLVLQQPICCSCCPEQERTALFHIKSSFDVQGGTDLYSIFTSWNKSSDCCSWDRVRCSATTKRVTHLDLSWVHEVGDYDDYTLNVSLFLPFRELQGLILSRNKIVGCIPVDCFWRLATLDRLENLDLSDSTFDANALSSLAALGSLKALSLHDNSLTSELFINASGALLKLRRLRYLDLSFNDLDESIIPYLAGLSSLKTLLLGSNSMGGGLPLNELSGLKQLEILDLSRNKFTGGIPSMVKEWNSLKEITVSNNDLNGTSLTGLCMIKKLQVLDLSHNNFSSDLPLCLSNLSYLNALDISYNQFEGNFPSTIFESLTMLEYVPFSNNDFKGSLSLGSLVNHTSIKILDLSNNHHLEIQTETPTSVPVFELEGIFLSNCIINKDNGAILNFISTQNRIQSVDLSNNGLKANIPTLLFENKTNLYYIALQNNSLSGRLILPPNLTLSLSHFDLSNNQLTGEIPMNIGLVLPNLTYLNLSHNMLQGVIPTSFSCLTQLEFLDLSHNFFSGQVPDSLRDLRKLELLDLSMNKFEGNLLPNSSNLLSLNVLLMFGNQLNGEIPESLCKSSSLMFMDISENQLSGALPSSIGNLSFLEVLNSKGNNLEGHLPLQFCNFSSLEFLDLSRNHFSGEIPYCLNLSSLDYLNLNSNSLTGSIPYALSGCRLRSLDLGNNHLSGNLPSWIGREFGDLVILSLRGNNFVGSISNQTCDLKHIHILDLSHNKLSGNIPSCLQNMGHDGDSEPNFMAEIFMAYPPRILYKYGDFLANNRGYDQEFDEAKVQGIDFSTKSQVLTYEGNIIKSFYGLDLSCNELTGEIPPEIGNIILLRALNLSNNLLTGPIPKTLSRLRNIESLDLSHNMLDGRIPSQLAELYSLEVFSVAYNNLSGPTLGLVSQFSTFNESSYKGNPYLCGPPLAKSCSVTVAGMPPSPPQSAEVGDDNGGHEEAMEYLIFFGSFALAYIMGFWGWMGLLYFKKSWQNSFFLATDMYTEQAIYKLRTLLSRIRSSR